MLSQFVRLPCFSLNDLFGSSFPAVIRERGGEGGSQGGREGGTASERKSERERVACMHYLCTCVVYGADLLFVSSIMLAAVAL
jgi:hypothetical protein